MLEKGRENWKGYALAIFFMTLVAITTALSAWLMKDVINEIFIDRNAAMVAPIAGFIFVIFLVKGFSSYAQNVILARIGNGIIADLQMRIFDHVQLQRIDFYRGAIEIVATTFARDLLTLIALIIVMIVQEPQLSVIALVFGPPCILGVAYLLIKIGKIARAEFQSLAKIRDA